MNRALESGITFFDTADNYPIGGGPSAMGVTESIVGRWLKDKRESVILATKCYTATGPNPWNRGNSRKHILEAIDASLRRLQTDYVDLMYLHCNDPDTPIDESLQALDDLVSAGKARYIGCSNFLSYQIARALGRSELRGLVRFASVQSRYNLLFRENERELLPLCLEEGLAMTPYNPLAGGMLTGTYERGTPAKGTRFTLGTAGARYQERYWTDEAFDAVDQLRQLSAEAGMSIVQLAISWLLANPAVTAPIVGADHPDHLAAPVAATQTPMPADLKQRVSDATSYFEPSDVFV